VHGWIYGLHDGRLRDLSVTVTTGDEIESSFKAAIAALA
jgi:carbonic anhydrase